ncbi:MAG: glycoside hydrolase family 25 protein [Eubacteriales bacterium]
MQRLGVDVSFSVSASTWGKLKNQGVTFAFIKASEGYPDSSSTDRAMRQCFINNVNAATSKGIMVGAYHFCRAMNVNTGSSVNKLSVETEVNLFLSNVIAAGGYSKIKLPLVIDMEDNNNDRYKTLTKEANTNIAKAYATAIAKAGFEPCLYLNNDFRVNCYNMANLGDLKLWFATRNTSYIDAKNLCPTMSFWQYAEDAPFVDVTQVFDVNECYIEFSETELFDHASYPGIQTKSGSPVYIDYTENKIFIPQSYTNAQLVYTLRSLSNDFTFIIDNTYVKLLYSNQYVVVLTRQSY